MSVLDDNLHAATHRKVRKDHMSQILTSHHDKSKYVHNRGKGRAHKSSKHSAYQCSIVSEQLNRMESHLIFSNIVVHFPNGLCCDNQKMQQTQDKLCKSVSEQEEQQTNNWMLQKIASGCFLSVRRQTIANVSECNANSEKLVLPMKICQLSDNSTTDQSSLH